MEEKIYEMLWDCPYCGAKKLLGKTHRFCPSCGAPQDQEKRYFPSESEKVAVQDHAYYGADRVCAFCKTATSARSKFCGQCGASLEGSVAARRVQDGAGAAASPPAPAGTRSVGRWLAWVAAQALLLAGLFAASMLWTRTATLLVSGHRWERTLEVERYDTWKDSAWCESVPSGGRVVSRRSEVRSHTQVPDGEDCRTAREDRGDGTYAEKQECSPRYRDEPVYGDKCDYLIDRWGRDRVLSRSGSSIDEPPAWPSVQLKAGSCLGCEREGARSERYTVLLRREGGGKEQSCDFRAEDRWRAFRPGARVRGKVRVMTGGVVCDRLSASAP